MATSTKSASTSLLSREQDAPINFEIVAERPSTQQRALDIGHDCYYTKIKRKLWPALVKDGRMSYGFRHERELLTAAQAAKKSEDEIRQIVREIEAIRPRIFEKLRAALHAAAA